MTYDFNANPYWDDYDETKKFLRILFRPGVAVQARELTQAQTILQNQVTRFGNHIFKNGSMVIPGQVSYDTEIGYVKLQNLNGSSEDISVFLQEFVGTKVTGGTSGVSATVIKATASEGSDPHTLHVKYVNSGTTNTTKVFQDNEDITSDAGTPRSARLLSASATGLGSVASIQSGIYYIYGFFVLVDAQTIVLDKYTNTPTYRVGLQAAENIITSTEDDSLNDNAQGSFNYAAPGAHRYKISLTLTKLTTGSTSDESFIELLKLSSGTIQYKIEKTDYSEIEKTLARRTYDESGNYTVTPFNIQLKEHRNNDRGTWINGRSYLVGDIVVYNSNYYEAKNAAVSGVTAPTHTSGEGSDGAVTWTYTTTPSFNMGVYDALDSVNPGDASKVAIGLEPGKAYVQGYEIEKVSTTYIGVDKARDFNRVADIKAPATVGNYVLVKSLISMPETWDQFATVALYDRLTATGGTAAGSQVGTARIRNLELDSTGIYKLFLFDVQMYVGKVFERNVKQIYYDNASIFNFTADVSPAIVQLDGSITAAGTSVTGVGTKFTEQLVAGDYIQVAGVNHRVASNPSTNYALTLDTSLTATGAVFYRVEAEYVEPDKQTLLFPVGQYAIRKIRSSDDVSYGTTYTVPRKFANQTTNSSGTFTINLSTSGETFASAAVANNYLVTKTSDGTPATPTVVITGGTSATFSGLSNTTTYQVIGTVNKTSAAAKEKTKSLNTFSTIDFTTTTTATASTLLLGKADVFKIRAIMMATAFGAYSGTGAIDITSRYTFDNGQRITHYDLGRVSLNAGQPVPKGTIRVIFDYFSHGAGDYFSVDSYAGVIEYNQIPSDLRDVYDFRPRIDDTGLNYTGTGASLTALPKRGIDIESDYSFYLPRYDKICIDFNGNFFDIEGIASTAPVEPTDPRLGMVLHKLQFSPYTFSMSDIGIETLNNKRYTMRDIGRLEKRIENVEYYTALSLLEQETKSLTIPDQYGLDRFKNGFIVDDFSGQGVGDTSSGDYRCAIDMENNELRPFFSMDNIGLIEKNTSTAQRTSNGYALTGDLITLPYSHTEAIKQPYASRWENINPFAVFTFIGSAELNPESDDWFETQRRPDLIVNQEGNFNAVLSTAEKNGVLGTVWNAWQTQWTGTSTVSTSTTTTSSSFLNRTTTTTTTTATPVGQSRTGVKTSLVAKVDTQKVDDRTISKATIPYIRSRNVLFVARGLKPNTRFYPFFDDISIASYITPATVITYEEISPFSTVFDSKTNVGGASNETARLIGGNPDSSLNRGDIITGNSGATAVVVHSEVSSTGVMKLHVVNVIGTFSVGDTIIGSISTARGSVTAITSGTAGGNLVTNFAGDICGLFSIPNTSSIRFRTGVREFKLVDSSTNGVDFTSKTSQQYRAQGILETKQATIVATRNAEYVQEAVSTNRTIVQTSTRTVTNPATVTWSDPLAQTFLVSQQGGMFITKVDIFFKTRDDKTFLPVIMQIREVVNGYPGKKIIPFSRVVKSWDAISVSETAATATTFTFDSPVYLQDATEYCIVLLSDSNNYNVWISQIGEKSIGTDRFISEQPYAGVLFKSQNASTWSADQLQDLKFTIHRASFVTETTGEVALINNTPSTDLLDNNPIAITSGTNIVRVFHRDHGMPNGSIVTIAGLPTATYFNIPSTQINGNHTIANADLDSYTFTATNTANASGLIGGNTITATRNIRYDSIQPSIQTQVFGDTQLDFDIKTCSLGYVVDTTGTSLISNETINLTSPRVVTSTVNKPAGADSLTIKGYMVTHNDAISPVIDTQRNSAILVSNRIDNPSASLNVAVVDDRVLVTTSSLVAIDHANNRITTSDAGVKAIFKTVNVGKNIKIAGGLTSANNGVTSVIAVATDGAYITVSKDLASDASTSITLTMAEKYVDEIAPVNGSASSKYVTKEISLLNSSTYFKVMFAYNKPQDSDIKIYYKTLPVGSAIPADQVNYTLLSPTTSLIPAINSNQFTDAEYTVTASEPFNAILVKIVMTSINTAMVPRLRDLRVIACA